MSRYSRVSGIAVLGLLVASVAAPAAAQEVTPDEVTAVIEAARSEMRASREQLLAVNLSLTTEEANGFWPLYREYNNKKAVIGDERLAIIKDYAASYPQVSDETAQSLVERQLKCSRNLGDLQQRYARKFAKVLPPGKLMRFLQVESRLDNLVELQIQRGVPIVEPPAG